MVRKFLFAAALAASSVVGMVSPAAAQRYGGVTLSVGSPYYGYGYDRSFYRDRAYEWRARDRWERRIRWERAREWRQRAARERRWYRDRNRFRDREWRWGY